MSNEALQKKLQDQIEVFKKLENGMFFCTFMLFFQLILIIKIL